MMLLLMLSGTKTAPDVFDREAHGAVVDTISVLETMLAAAKKEERRLRESHPDPMMRPSHWKGRKV